MDKTRITLLLTIVTLFSIVIPSLAPVAHAISYSVTATPSPISANEPTTIRVQVTGGNASLTYTFRVTVTKPSGAGQSSASTTFTTSVTGSGIGTLTYPSPSFTAFTGTVNTDIAGTYTVTVDRTGPGPPINGVAFTSFQTSYSLSVTILSPTQSSRLNRNIQSNITATVKYVDQKPSSTASVVVNTPTGSIPLTMTVPGTYTGTYKIQLSDNTGNWIVRVNATDGPNTGTGSVTVTITPATIIVYDLVTRNDQGSPTSVFYLGDNVYASFRLGYSGGGFLTSGSYNVQVHGPTGSTIALLNSTYDSASGFFSSPIGHTLIANDPDGFWQLSFPAGSLNDTYGNVGPGTGSQFKFTVHTSAGDLLTSSFGYILIACIALAGGVPSALALRRFNLKDAPFDDLFKLTGGELIPPTSLLILEDAGTGANTLALQLLSRELARERNCGILSYMSFPVVTLGKMREMGWDPAKYVEQGKLAILDCYSPLAGIEGSIIHDPSEFTEITNQVNALIEKSVVPFTLFLDSVSPIFNSTDRKTGIKFLTTLVARVKSKGGTFILTEIKGSLPEDVRIQIEAMMDGVIELSLVREGKHLQRSLWVKKVSDREVSNVERRFQIVSGHGLILKQPRLNFDKLS